MNDLEIAVLIYIARDRYTFRETADAIGVSTRLVQVAVKNLERSGHLVNVRPGKSRNFKLTDKGQSFLNERRLGNARIS